MNCLNMVDIMSKQRKRYRYTITHVALIFVRLFALLWKTMVAFHEGIGELEVWLHCFIISVVDVSDGQVCFNAALTCRERAPVSIE